MKSKSEIISHTREFQSEGEKHNRRSGSRVEINADAPLTGLSRCVSQREKHSLGGKNQGIKLLMGIESICKPPRFTVSKIEQVGMMNDTVKESGGDFSVCENVVPMSKFKISSDND